MDHIPPSAVTGAAMDSVVPKRRGRLLKRIAVLAAIAAALAWTGWQFVPHGLQVASRDVRLARVEQGVFRDDIVVRATAEPLNSIILDSVESGRVEEVFAKDGQAVKRATCCSASRTRSATWNCWRARPNIRSRSSTRPSCAWPRKRCAPTTSAASPNSSRAEPGPEAARPQPAPGAAGFHLRGGAGRVKR